MKENEDNNLITKNWNYTEYKLLLAILHDAYFKQPSGYEEFLVTYKNIFVNLFSNENLINHLNNIITPENVITLYKQAHTTEIKNIGVQYNNLRDIFIQDRA